MDNIIQVLQGAVLLLLLVGVRHYNGSPVVVQDSAGSRCELGYAWGAFLSWSHLFLGVSFTARYVLIEGRSPGAGRVLAVTLMAIAGIGMLKRRRLGVVAMYVAWATFLASSIHISGISSLDLSFLPTCVLFAVLGAASVVYFRRRWAGLR